MAGGWSQDGAVQDQIDASVEDAVKHARSQLGTGESRRDCVDCGEDIPEARRNAIPGVQRCISCQEATDEDQRLTSTINRRGSKDSQLR